MKIQSFQGGFDKNFCYLIWCDKTKQAALIDASTEINPIIEFIESKKLLLTKILITHSHHDHIYYIEDFKNYFSNILIYCYKNPINIQSTFYGVIHNEIITIGNEIITTLYTPGHFRDSICFWSKQHHYLFTGDTMFVGRTGRTVSSTSNIKELYNSIYNIILKLSENTIVYPGHNYGHIPYISLKNNKKLSNFFSCKNFDEFQLIMQNFEKNR